MHVNKGSKVILDPTVNALKETYPAANWITDTVTATLLEDCVVGTLDVFDVKTEDGSEESIYGFNIVEVVLLDWD